jgi:hypothetical protein
MALIDIIEKGSEPIPAAKAAFNNFMSNSLMNWVYIFVFGIIAALGVIPAMIIGVILAFIPLIGLLLAFVVYFAGIALTAGIGMLGLAMLYKETATTIATPVKIDPKILKIAGITLAAILGLGLIFGILDMTGVYRCNGVGFFPGSRTINTPFGQMTTKPGSEQVVIKTDKGTISAGAGLPDDFPKDVPVYPNAKVVGHFADVSTFSTSDSPDAVITYYSSNLSGQGWQLQNSQLGDIKTITGQKDGRTVSVTANPTEGKTDILITVAKQP